MKCGLDETRQMMQSFWDSKPCNMELSYAISELVSITMSQLNFPEPDARRFSENWLNNRIQTLVSVDPGKTGGIAIFKQDDYNTLVLNNAHMMPVQKIETKPKREVLDLKDGKKQYYKSGAKKDQVKMKLKSPAKYRTELDTKEILSIFQSANTIVLERQNPRPGNSASSSFTTGINYGKLLALAEATDAKLIIVAPQVWKKHFGLDLSLTEKKSMTPSQYKKMSIKKAYDLTSWSTTSDGIADSICIGKYVIEKDMHEKEKTEEDTK